VVKPETNSNSEGQRVVRIQKIFEREERYAVFDFQPDKHSVHRY
jgi:hypothetical protein